MWGGLLSTLAVGCADEGGASGGNAGDGNAGDGHEQVGGAPGMDSGNGGSSGEGGAPDAVGGLEAAARAALGADAELITDEEALVGHSFNLKGELCGKTAGASGEVRGGSSIYQLTVERSKNGKLTAVTVVAGGIAPQVSSTLLTRDGSGFALSNVVTCSSVDYVFENEFETHSQAAKQVVVLFARGEDGPKIALATAGEDGALVATGAPDLDAPTAALVNLYGVASIDGVGSGDFASYFAFSEPAQAGSEIEVVDSEQNAVDFEAIMSGGYQVGFVVHDVLSSDAELTISLTDLAGNSADPLTKAFPGIALSEVTGDFEQALDPSVDFYTSDLFNDGVASRACDGVGVYPSAELDSELIEGPAVPPLAGEHSFYTAGCEVYFRVQPPPSATKLLIDARLVTDEDVDERLKSWLRVWSLGAGDAPYGVDDERAWPIDEALSTESGFVSQMQTLSFPLSASEPDLLIALSGPGALWLDSLRFE